MSMKEPELAAAPGRTARVSEHRGPGEDGMEWFAAHDLDAVDRAVRDGRLRRVVFDSLGQVLTGLWNQEIDADCWLEAGVEVDLASSPGQHGALTHDLLASWSANARHGRRRRVAAGVVLSAVAVAAAFVLVWAVGR